MQVITPDNSRPNSRHDSNSPQHATYSHHPQSAIDGKIDPRKINFRPKKLIVCCDGTWQDSDNGWEKDGFFDSGHLQTPSNVTRLARAIRPTDRDGHPQIVYYQAGIGSGIGVWNHIAGGGTGLGFSENIREAYAFLASNYGSGNDTRKYEEECTPQDDSDRLRKYGESDKIFLTGFSRGAYTARSLGGLIGQLGLLRKEGMIYFYDIFSDWQHAGDPHYEPKFWKGYSKYRADKGLRGWTPDAPSDDYNKVREYLDQYRNQLHAFGLTQEVNITAVGVWDTVGALGIPVTPWLQKKLGFPSFIHSYKWVDTALDNHVLNAFHALALDERRSPFYPSVWEKPQHCTTNLKQVWFPGAHSNVGGGYKDESAANISLAWMMDQLHGDAHRINNPPTWSIKDWLEFEDSYLDKEYERNQEMYDRDYDEHQKKRLEHASSRKWPRRDKTDVHGEEKRRGWGMGTIYNSLTGFMAFAGERYRMPGRGRRMNYAGDYMDKDNLLTDTNEFIHASVRVRMDQGGKNFEADPKSPVAQRKLYSIAAHILNFARLLLGRPTTPSSYLPHTRGALKGWVLYDKHRYHDGLAINTIDPNDDDQDEPPYWEWEGQDRLLPPNGKILREDRLGTQEKRLLRRYENAAKIEGTNIGSQEIGVLKDQTDPPHHRKASTL